jgi:ATP-dependent DNA helicase RecQ
MNKEYVLQKYFGYSSFRANQGEIIDSILAGNDALVVMPTGGGKSLCFQVPALILPGITVVISPLISLMKDQVDNLRANGISAEFLNSSLSTNQVTAIYDKLNNGLIKIIYVSPERLAIEQFKAYLKTLHISLIAIDEAHCISEWGHDFRKEYRNLAHLKKTFQNVPVIALTATATPKVRADILRQLAFTKPKLFVTSANRPNLKLIIKQKQNTQAKIESLLEQYKKDSVIIYCFSKSETETLAAKLSKLGHRALAYHGGMSAAQRKKSQDLFIRDEVNIIVATTAFGMGIDKSNVRLVIHNTFPKSIAGYYQEIGRAGRDGLASECVLFYSRSDLYRHSYFIESIHDKTVKNATIAEINAVMHYCEDNVCRRKFILEYFGEESTDFCGNCDVCLNLIDEVTPKKKTIAQRETQVEPRFASGINVYSNPKSSQVIASPYTAVPKGENLFEQLRALRKKLAGRKRPYFIFKDSTLQEMVAKLPRTESEFLDLNGVGPISAQKYGAKFLEIIREHAPTINYDIELFEELRVLRKKIADARKVAPDVIFTDVTLQALATTRPTYFVDMLKIPGVVEHKMDDFGALFLDCIKSYELKKKFFENNRF